MSVSKTIFVRAMGEVSLIYNEEKALSEHYKVPMKKKMNEIIRKVVYMFHLNKDETNDLITELAKFFGRRGGKAKRRPKKRTLSKALILELYSMAKQANEHICPID